MLNQEHVNSLINTITTKEIEAVIKNQVTADADENMEKEEHSSIVCRIASWYKHYENQSGSSSEHWI